MPWWFLSWLVLVTGVVLIVLIWAALQAWREARHARMSRADPALWVIDAAGYYWVPVDGLDGYVPVRAADGLRRTTFGPKDPPELVSRKWIAEAVGIAQVVDPQNLPGVDATES